jgi:hypothetical protein
MTRIMIVDKRKLSVAKFMAASPIITVKTTVRKKLTIGTTIRDPKRRAVHRSVP